MRLKTINIYTFLPGAWAGTHKMRHFILVFHCFPHVRLSVSQISLNYTMEEKVVAK